jgi:hypothetical protein
MARILLILLLEMNMNGFKRIVLGIFALVLLGTALACGPKYGYHPNQVYGSYGYRDERGAYEEGYRRGYDHGWSDRREGAGFNYEHDDAFRRGISNDQYLNNRYRQGYVRGYENGYHGSRRY